MFWGTADTPVTIEVGSNTDTGILEMPIPANAANGSYQQDSNKKATSVGSTGNTSVPTIGCAQMPEIE